MIFLNLVKNIAEGIYPFYGSAVILFIAFILLFFALSGKKNAKIFFLVFSFAGISVALVLNIIMFLQKGLFSNYLFSYDRLELIKTGIILFAAINILVVISINKFEEKNFIKILLIFLLTIVSFTFYIPASNFIMIFTSLVFTISGIFMLFTSLNSDIGYTVSKEYILRNHTIRFFTVSLFALALMLAGYSVMYGSTDLKSFVQLIEAEKITDPMIKTGLFVLYGSLFVYLFIFPLQSAYIKLLKRCESASATVIWFLYFPAGLFLFLKMRKVFFYFAEGNIYIIYAVYIVAFVCIAAGNIGAVKSSSIKRILAFFYYSVFGTALIFFGFSGSGLLEENMAAIAICANLSAAAFTYFPFHLLSAKMEQHNKKDEIANLYGLLKQHKYLGVCLVIILLGFPLLLLSGTFFSFTNFIEPVIKIISVPAETGAGSGTFSLLNYLGAGTLMTGVLFLIINVVRLIAAVGKTRISAGDGSREAGKISLPKFYYIYLTLYCLAILFLLAGNILKIFDISIFPLEASEFIQMI